jgi:AP-1 complex subunit beta-1
MSCLRAEKIISYLSEPLHRSLRDENPYVRKTAALAVAKLWDLKPSLALEGGFVEVLREMVGDGNPMVVANAVTALSDIQEAYHPGAARPGRPTAPTTTTTMTRTRRVPCSATARRSSSSTRRRSPSF